MKRCPDCKEVKPLSAFGVMRSASDNIHIYCRSCNNARSAAYRLSTVRARADAILARRSAS